jgi:hypothetical protein
MLNLYRQHKAYFVQPDLDSLKKLGLEVIAAPLVSNYVHRRNCADKLKRSFLRHDARKTAKLIWKLTN